MYACLHSHLLTSSPLPHLHFISTSPPLPSSSPPPRLRGIMSITDATKLCIQAVGEKLFESFLKEQPDRELKSQIKALHKSIYSRSIFPLTNPPSPQHSITLLTYPLPISPLLFLLSSPLLSPHLPYLSSQLLSPSPSPSPSPFTPLTPPLPSLRCIPRSCQETAQGVGPQPAAAATEARQIIGSGSGSESGSGSDSGSGSGDGRQSARAVPQVESRARETCVRRRVDSVRAVCE